MRHDWILDVLADIRTYAQSNDLPAIAQAATQMIEVAEIEIAVVRSTDTDAIPD